MPQVGNEAFLFLTRKAMSDLYFLDKTKVCVTLSPPPASSVASPLKERVSPHLLGSSSHTSSSCDQGLGPCYAHAPSQSREVLHPIWEMSSLPHPEV